METLTDAQEVTKKKWSFWKTSIFINKVVLNYYVKCQASSGIFKYLLWVT